MAGSFPASTLRHTALIGSLAMMFELASPLATAGTVTSCDDGPNAAQLPGTLRYEIANAPEGGTVDIDLQGYCTSAKLPGSVITLETGGITGTQNSLTINGNGVSIIPDKYGFYNGLQPVKDRVFYHQGPGTLALSNLNLAYGKYIASPVQKNYGGCLYSKGSLSLSHVTIAGCEIVAQPTGQGDAFAYGAAVFARGSVTIAYSMISDSKAVAEPALPGVYYNGFAKCGGIDAQGYLTLRYSTVAGNYVNSPIGFGGGICAEAGARIEHSTISGNTATRGNAAIHNIQGGGLIVGGGNFILTESTVSGNSSSDTGGGVVTESPSYIRGTTIAFNHAGFRYDDLLGLSAAGLALRGDTNTIDVLLNTIVAYNTVGSPATEDDLSEDYDISGHITPLGANDIVLASQQPTVTLPPGSIAGQCPLLGPLRNNGGPTDTHALLSTSPAIDAGASSAATTDQRLLPRASPPGFPDIGAYEVQQDDIVFNSGFQGCP